jgi:hypothetical protein
MRTGSLSMLSPGSPPRSQEIHHAGNGAGPSPFGNNEPVNGAGSSSQQPDGGQMPFAWGSKRTSLPHVCQTLLESISHRLMHEPPAAGQGKQHSTMGTMLSMLPVFSLSPSDKPRAGVSLSVSLSALIA